MGRYLPVVSVDQLLWMGLATQALPLQPTYGGVGIKLLPGPATEVYLMSCNMLCLSKPGILEYAAQALSRLWFTALQRCRKTRLTD